MPKTIAGATAKIRTPKTIWKQTEREISKGIEQILQLDGWRTLPCEPMSGKSISGRIKAALSKHPALVHVLKLIFSIIDECVWAKGFGEVGMPDLLAIRYELVYVDGYGVTTNALVMWVEMKAPGGRVSPAQRIWHDVERERGALTIILGQDCEASVVGFVDWYRQSGLNRRVA